MLTSKIKVLAGEEKESYTGSVGVGREENCPCWGWVTVKSSRSHRELVWSVETTCDLQDLGGAQGTLCGGEETGAEMHVEYVFTFLALLSSSYIVREEYVISGCSVT